MVGALSPCRYRFRRAAKFSIGNLARDLCPPAGDPAPLALVCGAVVNPRALNGGSAMVCLWSGRLFPPKLRPQKRSPRCLIKREDAMRVWASVALGTTMFGTLGLGTSAMAAEIIIFANQGAASATRDLAPAFERA